MLQSLRSRSSRRALGELGEGTPALVVPLQIELGQQPFRRGVTRTYAQACMTGSAWSQEWFATLTADQQQGSRTVSRTTCAS